MSRLTVVLCVVLVTLASARGASASRSASVAALQVALRAQGLYVGSVDGVAGPLTKRGLAQLQSRRSLRPAGGLDPETRRALGTLGAPLLGQRLLGIGAEGWDVSALEFKLTGFGLRRSAVDGRFTAATALSLRRFQRAHGLQPDGIAGAKTYRALAGGRARSAARTSATAVHTVQPGEGFYTIASHYHVSALALARRNGLRLTNVLLPGQRLRLPAGARALSPAPRGARARSTAGTDAHVVLAGEGFYPIAARYGVSPWDLARVNGLSLQSTLLPGQILRLPAGAHAQSDGSAPTSKDAVRASIDHWSAVYGVDPQLARALAWMESGFQPDVVSNVGAVGVMQLLPVSWEWVDLMLIGAKTPRSYDGNIQAGIRYLRWQLDQFGGNPRLALAGYYQGARAVREHGLYEDTKQYVSVIMQLYDRV
jgi:soluble lytic murein transglycosylase-like protein